jgi:xanthine/CO dehydrogenase XdhC/CoxF family maturation factor
MNVTGLVRFFEQRRERGEPLALVTIYETSGSTYSKAGAHMAASRATSRCGRPPSSTPASRRP